MDVRQIVGGCLAGAMLLAPLAQAQQQQMQAQQQHIIQQEKEIVWGEGPPGLPPGMKMAVLHGDPGATGLFGLRARLPANYRIPAHFHSTAEHINIISGTFYLGAGERLDPNGGKALGPGGFAMLPAQMHHYAYTREPVTLVLYGMGPFDINYLNPADDPRGSKPQAK